VAEAALCDIADQARVWARARAVDPERRADLGQMPCELLLRNAGLDDGIAQLGSTRSIRFIRPRSTITCPSVDRARVAITPVLAGADRIESRPAATRDLDQFDDLVARARLQTAAGRRLEDDVLRA